ncbi:uncharacterized protein BDW70DRAFT_158937 [Aspergillus foveolatus]|uniref:uncharacterized protein n=1 Tax=Aspergillus foveolatus TaxID=210207 RepID=UPI003CCDDA15
MEPVSSPNLPSETQADLIRILNDTGFSHFPANASLRRRNVLRAALWNNLATIHEREALKQCEREKTVQQARYETSLVYNEPVDAAYGLATHPVGSMSLPSSAWPTAVISSADDVPSLLPLRFTTATPTTPSGDQHVPATLADLLEGVPMPSILSPQHEDRFVAVHRSVTNARPTPFAPPDSHPSSPTSLTYCQSKSTTNAGIPATTITHRDQPSGDPRHRTPFDLSSGLPLPKYLLTAPVKRTHNSEADPRLNARRCSLLESSYPLTTDRPSAPTIHGGCSGSRNLGTLSSHSNVAAPGPAQVSMPQPPNENRKRSFSAFSADDSLIVSPSSRNFDSRSSLRHTVPCARFDEPVAPRAALRSSWCLGERKQPRPPRPATDPRVLTTIDRVCISLAPAAMKMVSQPPAWPNPPDISSFAPVFATATAWPLSSSPPPPALPSPEPGYVWTGSDWHGPF